MVITSTFWICQEYDQIPYILQETCSVASCSDFYHSYQLRSKAMAAGRRTRRRKSRHAMSLVPPSVGGDELLTTRSSRCPRQTGASEKLAKSNCFDKCSRKLSRSPPRWNARSVHNSPGPTLRADRRSNPRLPSRSVPSASLFRRRLLLRGPPTIRIAFNFFGFKIRLKNLSSFFSVFFGFSAQTPPQMETKSSPKSDFWLLFGRSVGEHVFGSIFLLFFPANP